MDILSILSIRKLLIIAMFMAVLGGFFISPASADVLSDRIQDVQAAQNEEDLVNSILGLAIPIATLCLIGLGVYSGYTMVTSQGNPEKINEAREAITNAVLGFALIGLSVAVLLLIQDVLQIPGI